MVIFDKVYIHLISFVEGTEPLELVIPQMNEFNYLDLFKQYGQGSGLTAWSHRPLMRIDYIFCSSNWQSRNPNFCISKCFVFDTLKKSDHFAVVVELDYTS